MKGPLHLLAAMFLGCAASSTPTVRWRELPPLVPPDPDTSRAVLMPGPGSPYQIHVLFREPDGQIPDYGKGYESYKQGKALWKSQDWKASAESFIRAAEEFVPYRGLSEKNTICVHKSQVGCLKNAIMALRYAGGGHRQAEVEALLADSLRISRRPSNPSDGAGAATPSEGDASDSE